MDNQHELFDQPTDEDQPAPDYIAPSLIGSLAPIMHPESLARIEANFTVWLNAQEWYQERRAREAAACST